MSGETGTLVGFVLSLLIYSFLVKDNPLYRLAIHLLVGVSAAYAAVIAVRHVVLPALTRIASDPSDPVALLWLVPVMLALFLFLRRIPSIGWLGNSTMGLLVGIGAAVALTGAISGTLVPQVTGANEGRPIASFFIAILTVCTLFTFQFTGRRGPGGEWERPRWQSAGVFVGKVVLTVTFAVLFVSVFGTSVILLIERVDLYLDYFTGLLS